KESTVCPYFKALSPEDSSIRSGRTTRVFWVREDAKDAELLLLPYDYLIGQGTRESLQVASPQG
ncbi:unnamed protein product, partial [Durusdinium trenchii]